MVRVNTQRDRFQNLPGTTVSVLSHSAHVSVHFWSHKYTELKHTGVKAAENTPPRHLCSETEETGEVKITLLIMTS